MVTIPFWLLIALVQALVLLTAATGFLAWRLRVAFRAATRMDSPSTREEPAAGDAVRTYLDQALEQTRVEQHAGDRNLPNQVLETRLHYLESERDALDYANQADRFWAHLCERLENAPTAAPAEAVGDEDGSLETTHQRLRHILGQLDDGGGESEVTVRQLAVIERRLAALQRQEPSVSEDATTTPEVDTEDGPVTDQASAGGASETQPSAADSEVPGDAEPTNAADTSHTSDADRAALEPGEDAGNQGAPAPSDGDTNDPAPSDDDSVDDASETPRSVADSADSADDATADADNATGSDGEVKNPADDTRA